MSRAQERYKELAAQELAKAKAFNSAFTRKLVQQHPDADWGVTDHWTGCRYIPKVTGEIYLGEVSPEEGDLLELADSCDEDSIYVDKIFFDNTIHGVLYTVKVAAYQAMTPEQVETLCGIGKIVTEVTRVPERTETRTYLACQI